ncbi:MAG: CHASE3 domain-containing protein, partial [bacterium]
MKVNPKVMAWFVGSSLLVALVVAPSLLAFRQTEDAAEARKFTYDVIERAGALVSALIDAETGQRGYLLTDDEVFLEPYAAVRDTISGQLANLRQVTTLRAAKTNLDALAPLIEQKLAYLSQSIELRRNNDLPGALANMRSSQGKQLMDQIRAELCSFIQTEKGALAQKEAKFQANMHRLLIVIVIASLVTLLFAFSLVHVLYRGAQQRLKDSVHRETQRLLQIQEETNIQLQQANITL